MLKKRIFPILLALLLCVALAGCSAFASEQSNNENEAPQATAGLAYELTSDGEGYICTGIGSASTTDIVIPATYKDKPVIMIANGAFYNCVTLTSVTIREGVQAIQDYAFRGCVRLETVSIPGSVFYVGARAFELCSSLETVTIANNAKEFEKPEEDVRMIGESAFKGCTALTSLTLPEEIVLLSRRLLDGCSALQEITIPARVEAIDEGAFAGCSGLKTIHYEGTVEQWNKLPKGMVWDLEIENCTVVCSDGSVTLN